MAGPSGIDVSSFASFHCTFYHPAITLRCGVRQNSPMEKPRPTPWYAYPAGEHGDVEAPCRPFCEPGPNRFFFYASDGSEPLHVHVERDDCMAKY